MPTLPILSTLQTLFINKLESDMRWVGESLHLLVDVPIDIFGSIGHDYERLLKAVSLFNW